MPYPTTAALVAASSVAELTSLTVPQQDALRDVAISAVERYTGQQFISSVVPVTIDGGGARELYLPTRVDTLTNIVVKGTSIDLTDVVLSPSGDRLHFVPQSTNYAVVAMREHAYDTRTFRSGAGTIVLSGVFGWTVCPPAVVQALRIEMEVQAAADASALSGIVASARRLGMTNLSQGNLRAAIGDPSEIAPQAARLLAKYVWLGQGGSLA